MPYKPTGAVKDLARFKAHFSYKDIGQRKIWLQRSFSHDSTEDLGVGGRRCMRAHGSVVFVVRLHNKEWVVDACLSTLNRCSDMTCTRGPITGCYSVINS